jgi:8-oxo-dGTP pyrophosphatase MutT (NUDIX family)
MYLTAEAILELEKKYGSPEEVSLAYEMTQREFDMVRSSQKHGRAHDVSLFIIADNRVVVIKKPMYPAGAYRAPSGGIAPGEPFEQGTLREAYEETGLTVSLDRYILRARVRFTNSDRLIDWTSHVFTASALSEELEPIDTHEIVEARFATVDELKGSIRNALLGSGSTGLKYRSELTDQVMRILFETGAIEA